MEGVGPLIQSTSCLSNQMYAPFGPLQKGGKRANQTGATEPEMITIKKYFLIINYSLTKICYRPYSH